MDDAGRRDQFIRRIALEVQLRGLPANGQVERPDMHSREDPAEFGGLQVDCNTAQLSELRHLPKNDRRDAPGISRQQFAFGGRQRTVQRKQENVGVKIQHPT